MVLRVYYRLKERASVPVFLKSKFHEVLLYYI